MRGTKKISCSPVIQYIPLPQNTHKLCYKAYVVVHGWGRDSPTTKWRLKYLCIRNCTIYNACDIFIHNGMTIHCNTRACVWCAVRPSNRPRRPYGDRSSGCAGRREGVKKNMRITTIYIPPVRNVISFRPRFRIMGFGGSSSSRQYWLSIRTNIADDIYT